MQTYGNNFLVPLRHLQQDRLEMKGGEKMQYEVYVRLTTSKYISVEADSKEEAEEIAKAEFIDDIEYLLFDESDISAEVEE